MVTLQRSLLEVVGDLPTRAASKAVVGRWGKLEVKGDQEEVRLLIRLKVPSLLGLLDLLRWSRLPGKIIEGYTEDADADADANNYFTYPASISNQKK
jgi:hypothetical protein